MQILQIEHTLSILDIQDVFDFIRDLFAAWLELSVLEALFQGPDDLKDVAWQMVVEMVWLSALDIEVSGEVAKGLLRKWLIQFLWSISYQSHLWFHNLLVILFWDHSRSIEPFCALKLRMKYLVHWQAAAQYDVEISSSLCNRSHIDLIDGLLNTSSIEQTILQQKASIGWLGRLNMILTAKIGLVEECLLVVG